MPESLPRGVATFTRRTTLGALPLVALAGCRWGPEDEESPEVEQAQDADAGLVKSATQAIAVVLSAVVQASGEHIGLASALTPLSGMHVAHMQLLAGSADAATIDTGEPRDRTARAALTRIRREEARLQTQLADLASTATSGSLARALASMSASIAQHLTALPDLAQGPA